MRESFFWLLSLLGYIWGEIGKRRKEFSIFPPYDYTNYPDLTLDGVQIEIVPEFKFLGLLFDSKLLFIPHINYLSNKCQKALNLLRVVSSMDWGADRKVLLRLYRTLVRSKLDYGCIVYGSARQSYLQKLDSIHNQGLRLALGAFRTSVNSLYAEANEPSLNVRRKKLSLN